MNSMKIFKSNLKRDKKSFLLILPFILITILLVIIPMVIIVVKSFVPTSSGPVYENWNFVGYHVWEKILITFGIAVLVSILCFVLGYFFAYFLSLKKGKTYKIFVICIITSPIWLNFLVKLIGLKMIFDYMNGGPNSSYGHLYTIISLVYLNLPLFILTIYNYLDSIPKNLIEASKDLGKTSSKTFLYVILPYTKNAIIAAISLVFFSSFTTAGVSTFVNNSNDGGLVGSELLNQGQIAPISEIALARISTFSLIVSLVLIFFYCAYLLVKYFYSKYYGVNKNKTSNKRKEKKYA